MEIVTVRAIVDNNEKNVMQARLLDTIPWVSNIDIFVHPMFLHVPNGTVFEITLKPSKQGACRIVSYTQLSDGCAPEAVSRYYLIAWNEDDFGPMFDDLLGPYSTLDEAKGQAQGDFARIMVIGTNGQFETLVEGEYDPDEDTMVWND